jgi:putative membrane protein
MTSSLSTLAQDRIYSDHMNGAWGWGMATVMILAVVAIVALVVWLVRSTHVSHGPAHPAAAPPETPTEILDRRLARGEIAPEEHRERLAALSGP